MTMNNEVEVVGRLIPESGKVHQNQEVYNTIWGGIIGTLKATCYKDPPKILIRDNAYETEQKGD